MIIDGLIRSIYGPASLILDRMFIEMNNGGSRPLNNWDSIFLNYDEKITLLGVTDKYTDGISYTSLIEAKNTLSNWGARVASVGLNDWFEMIKKYIEDPENTIKSMEALQELRHQHDWMYSPENYLSPSDLRFSLLGEESVYQQYESLTKDQIITLLTPKIRCEAAAKFSAIL